MIFTLVLCMRKKQGEQLIRTFFSNYPDYNINFIFSKELPEKNQGDGHPIFLCDCDDDLLRLQKQYPDVPMIAVSHDANVTESLMGCPWLILSPEALTPEYLDEVYCRCKRIPLTILETTRCRLRELTPEDLPGLLLLQSENASNTDGCFFPADCPQPDTFLADYIYFQYPFFGYGLYGIFDKNTEHFMGIAGYHEDSKENTAETPDIFISYALLQKYHHHGFAREVIAGLITAGKERWGFQNFFARISPDNSASLRAARDTGLRIIFPE